MAGDTKAPGRKQQASKLCSGEFRLRFAREQDAREAGRSAGAVGFSTDVRADAAAGWLLTVVRRSQPFPIDEQERYCGRLRTIAATHGGSFEGFVQD
jgi:hypothetical protein